MKHSLLILLTGALSVCAFSVSAQTYGHDALPGDNSGVIDRFVTRGAWPCPIIPFFIVNGTEDIAGNGERASILAALATWEAATNIRFIESCDEATSLISFTFTSSGDHGDNSPFDDNTLAHAFFPVAGGTIAGDVHFNDGDNQFTTDTDPNDSSPFDLQTVTLHELGHALGLDHSEVNNAVMEEDYEGSRRTLTNDDINGIRSMYGAPDVSKLIKGLPYLCQVQTYSVCVPAGLTVQWQANSAITILSGQNTSTVTVVKAYDGGLGTLKATISNGCNSIVLTRTINTGYSEPLYAKVGPTLGGYPVQSYFTPCAIPYNYFTTQVQSQYAITFGWEWVSGPGYINYSSSNTSSGYVGDNGLLTIRVSYVNAQGCVARNLMLFINYKQGMAVLPNPADDQIVIQLDSPSAQELPAEYLDLTEPDRSATPLATAGTIKSVRIFDFQGRLVLEHTAEKDADQEMLDITTLEPGTYLVEVLDGSDRKQVKSFVKQ